VGEEESGSGEEGKGSVKPGRDFETTSQGMTISRPNVGFPSCRRWKRDQEMKATGLREAIINIFENEPGKRFTLREIYESIPDHCELTEDQKEVDEKYLHPHFHHEARSIIAALEKEGVIERLDKDRRRLTSGV
jgi:hypothetical protein